MELQSHNHSENQIVYDLVACKCAFIEYTFVI